MPPTSNGSFTAHCSKVSRHLWPTHRRCYITPALQAGHSMKISQASKNGKSGLRAATTESAPKFQPIQISRVSGTWQTSHVDALRNILVPHLGPSPFSTLPAGSQIVSHNEVVPESELDEDGAEIKYAPGPQWKFRVWAGASSDYLSPTTDADGRSNVIEAIETIDEIRYTGDPNDDDCKAFVTIGKVYRIAGTETEYKDSSPHKTDVPSITLIKESKRLCFMKQIPDSLKSDKAVKSLRPPLHDESTHLVTMTPTPTLLFRFSGLTDNAHKIHYDPEFTKQIYGVPKLIVHGPLTGVLMQEVLKKVLLSGSKGLGDSNSVVPQWVHRFEYRNIAPLWVDEEITIGCRPLPRGNTSSGAEDVDKPAYPLSWETWIESTKDGVTSLAVKGKALVGPYPNGHRPK